ncbi:MAG TPA: PIN domain-containing protein [Candidatus Eisenbacteria bacterium]
MIYLDSSVALAQIQAESRRPSPGFWDNELVASRLLQYETWTRLHAAGRGQSHGEAARILLAGIMFIELTPEILEPLVEGFRLPLKTLDAIHLATLRWLDEQQTRVQLATYDEKLASTARRLGFELHPVSG